MAKITKTIWEMEPHTEAKQVILRKYLDAWLPIISKWNGRILYIDGFAGPGEYIGGKDGSPIIAIKSIIEHKFDIDSEVVMIFIEASNKRCEFLKHKVSTIKTPKNVKIDIICEEFSKTLSGILDYLKEQKKRIAPSFVFIAPFGFTGIPFSLIKRIMGNKRCEVLITFMYEEINRFISQKNLWDGLVETFGTDKWKEVITNKIPHERLLQLHNIYKNQLENEAGIKYVLSFKMINKFNRTDYFLFFGTNSITGLSKMKAAMWKVDVSGSFEFSDVCYNQSQTTLFGKEPDFGKLKKIILENFKGSAISIEELEEFILSKTPFRETHYKRQILKPMEIADPPELTIRKCNDGRKIGTYSDKKIIVEFL